ncbi:hypothetical protein [Helicobacter suis]|uniref:hypothetical protein n=1 Tax=Helicobacter suis TaxID=104628 RepID=UPI0013D78F20|nr:hypothetical protein [Helicobacter suis]
MLKSVLYMALVGVLCSVQTGKGNVYFSMVQKVFEHKDYQKALAYFKKAADVGGNHACYYNLESMYFKNTKANPQAR